MVSDEVLTPEEAAELLKVSKKTILRLVRSGAVPGSKVGHSWRFRRSELLAHLKPTGGEQNIGDVYLDYNASTPLDPVVLEEMLPFLIDGYGNASSIHDRGRTVRAAVENSRSEIAELVGSQPGSVILTSGATEANNTALKGLLADAPHDRRRIIVSAAEHSSVLAPAKWLADNGSAQLDIAPLTPAGQVDLEALSELLSPDVAIVSVIAANGETGVINPIGAIAKLTHAVGARFHCDATQLIGRAEFDMESLEVDALTLSGHKVYGPQGTGALILTRPLRRALTPLLHGGGQEKGLRSGTTNVAGAVGLGVAARCARDDLRKGANAHIAMLRDALWEGLAATISEISINGESARRLPNTLNVRFVGADADAVLANLQRVSASAGSACHAGAPGPSPVLTAMGIGHTAAAESLRFSLGRMTTLEEVQLATADIRQAVERVRSMNIGEHDAA